MATLTREEHITRAMLLGMYYHEGNGEPFYYKKDSDGVPDVASFIDAETLERMVDYTKTPSRDWDNIRKRRAGLEPWLK